MDLPPLIQAAVDRLATFFNGGVYEPSTDNDPGNPGGFDGDGHAINFVRALRDVATVAAGIASQYVDTLVEMTRIYNETQIAAVLVEGGPVSSVQVGDGPVQTGAVRINLDTLSAQINDQLTQVKAAQTSLEARAASTQAYVLAFGA